MGVGARRNLRGVSYSQHLHLLRQPLEPAADGIGNCTADAGVDFIEDQYGRRTSIGEDDLESKKKTRQLAAGSDLHQRARKCARIRLHVKSDLIEAGRRNTGLIALLVDDK